jgi:type I protein arginine methyltransferase
VTVRFVTYSLYDYGSMLGDPARAESHARALARVIQPGAVVLDLGAGTGIFSLLACRLGARHVHACDTSPALQVGRELARANGLGDLVTFHECSSEALTLPEPADVIVSDLRGRLPLHGRSLPTIIDARTRHLKAGGVLIPRRDLLWVALAEAPDEYRETVAPWKENDFGFDLGAWSALLGHGWRGTRVPSEAVVSPAALWAAIDYRTIQSPDIRGKVHCVASRAATAHGFFVWFDAELAEGVGFSGGPGAPKMPYGAAFFPWPSPLDLAPGDEAEIDIEAVLVGDDYVWNWKSCVRAHGAETRFVQSTFLGTCLSPETLRKRSGDYVPELTREGRLTLRVLEELGQGRRLGEIAEALLAEFPGRFRNSAESLGFVGELSDKYGG